MMKYTILGTMNCFASLSGNSPLIVVVAVATFSVFVCDMVRAAIEARRMCE